MGERHSMDYIVIHFLQFLLWIALGTVVLMLLAFIVHKVGQAYSNPVKGPRRKLIGQLGKIVTPIGHGQRGKVLVYGEIWDAECHSLAEGESLEKDVEVQVSGFHDIDPRVLKVTRHLHHVENPL